MNLVLGALAMNVSTGTQFDLYRAIAGLFKEQGDKLLHAVALEKAVELHPSDRDNRFAAAYAESEADLPHLSSANYQALIDQNPKSSAVAMNNLAVEVDSLKLPVKAVALYRAAMKEGETLATANFAYKLLNQGFLDEARELLNEAKKRDDVHQNVNEALADAAKRESAEQQNWTRVLKQGAVHRLFFHQLAEARFRPCHDTAPFDGTWKAPNGTTIKIEEATNSEVSIIWGPEEGTFAMFAGSPKRKLEGRRTNRALIGELLKWNKPIVGGAGHFDITGPRALAYVSSDGTRIEVLSLDNENPTIFQFTRLPEAGASLASVGT
ncbi:MAG: hypothetical protein HYY76_17755 [Acidobacteria bacterium]|nr:hypothetical protein [Acidobacteriota bacterium]